MSQDITNAVVNLGREDGGRQQLDEILRGLLSSSSGAVPTIAGLGDSITANGKLNTLSTQARGYLAWLPAITAQRVYAPVSMNFGVSGETSAQILARVGQVAAANPGICVVHAGTNDVTTSATVANTTTNLAAIYDALASAGIIVIAIPILPRGSLTTTQYGKIHQINDWIRRQRLSRRRFYVADCTKVFANPATGSPLSSLVYDTNLHPNAAGAYAIASVVAPIVNNLVPASIVPFSNPADLYSATDNPTGNLLANGHMSGTSGSLSSGPTGSLASNWAAAGTSLPSGVTAAFSKVTQSDGRVFQQMALSGSYTGASGKFIDVSHSGTGANISPGDVIEAMCEIEWDFGLQNVGIPELTLFVNGGSSQSASVLYTASIDAAPGGPVNLIARTMPITVQTGASSFGVYLRTKFVDGSLTAAATIRFGSVSIRKVIS